MCALFIFMIMCKVCNFQFPDPSVAKVFNTTVYVEEGTSGQGMNISLAQPLDFETRSFYSFLLIAEVLQKLKKSKSCKNLVVCLETSRKTVHFSGKFRARFLQDVQFLDCCVQHAPKFLAACFSLVPLKF